MEYYISPVKEVPESIECHKQSGCSHGHVSVGFALVLRTDMASAKVNNLVKHHNLKHTFSATLI